MFLFRKAIIPGGAAGDLFAAPIMVQGYARQDGTYVVPHASTRHKRTIDEKLTRRGETVESVGTSDPVVASSEPAKPRLPRDGDHIEFRTPAAGGKLRWARARVERIWSDNWQMRVIAAPPRSKLAHSVGKQLVIYGPTGPFGLKDWRVVGADAPLPEEATVRLPAAVLPKPLSVPQAPTAPAQPETPPATPSPDAQVAKKADADVKRRTAQAAKLRQQADRDMAAAEESLGRDRLANTARRARMAAGATQTANNQAQIAETMRNFADAIEWGEAKHLLGITTRAHVETLDLLLRRGMYANDRKSDSPRSQDGRAPTPADIMAAHLPKLDLRPGMARDIARDLERKAAAVPRYLTDFADRPDEDAWINISDALARDIVQRLDTAGEKHTGWYLRDALKDRDRLARIGITNDNELRLALAEYVIYRGGARSEDPIKKAERELVGFKGIDFFPTPPALVDRLAEAADIKPGQRVLEPSAGKGDIADRLRQYGAQVDCVELGGPPRAILEAKRHTVVGTDFDAFEAPPGGYDRVVMNPPFSRDAEHVRRAFDMLKPGGRLVAIVSRGLAQRSDSRAADFRDWVEQQGGTMDDLPEGSFKSAFRPTGVATTMVVLDRDTAALEVGPQEGDTKVEGGVTYVLRDSRWHRVDAPEESAPPAAQETPETQAAARVDNPAPAPSPEPTVGLGVATFEEAIQDVARNSGGASFRPEDVAARWKGTFADDVLDQLHARPNDFALLTDGTWQRMADYTAAPDRPDEIARLTDALGQDRLPEDTRARWKRQLRLLADALADRAPDQPEAGPSKPADEPLPDDLDPSSPNYRYRDTGYIAGSRKEMAAESIRRAARQGDRVRTTDVDWTELEQNPREAKALITKANVFGDVDWRAMQERGVEPGAGFLISRIYASVASEPLEDTPQGRRDFTTAIDSLRDRAEKAKTAQDVTRLLEEIADERDGYVLNAEEAAAMQAIETVLRAEGEKVMAIRNRERELEQAHSVANSARYRITAERDKRVRRGWKVAPEMEAEAQAAMAVAERASKELQDYRDQNGTRGVSRQSREDGGVSIQITYPFRARYDQAYALQRRLRDSVVARNQIENPLTRAWRSLGTGFNAVVDYRRHRGSDAFAQHVATVKASRVKDWSWAEQKREVKGATKQSTRFQLRVADQHERTGGRDIKVASTADLKRAFGLRDVQSGKWVLEDPNSAKFHTERCAEAFADLADLLGVPDDQVAMKGRLAMAFGARGSGAKGWATEGAPAAHYESIQRVINITKMAGGGSLAHEWFHFLDNVLSEAVVGKPAGADTFVTENPGDLPPDLGAAVRDLSRSLMEGPHRRVERMAYTEGEAKWARGNVDTTSFYGGKIRTSIREAGSMQEAVDAVERLHDQGALGTLGRQKTTKNFRDWRRIALIYHAERERAVKGLPDDVPREASYAYGPGMSMFLKDANDLDQGNTGKYWSRPREMAARAFQAWCEDKLAAQGRVSTYLNANANNEVYRLFGQRPFPEGEERQRIVAAFDRFVDVIRERGDLAKALALLAW